MARINQHQYVGKTTVKINNEFKEFSAWVTDGVMYLGVDGVIITLPSHSIPDIVRIVNDAASETIAQSYNILEKDKTETRP